MLQPQVDEIDEGVFLIDHHFQGVPGVIASYLLVGHGDGELALVEAGPGSTTETLLAGVRAAGFDPGAIRHVLLTHIHLDHAGAAGSLARRLSHARVYVHRLGAAHLMDPAKLLASATRIYGDRMETLWGPVLPVPPERLVVLDDDTPVRFAGRTLWALDTPGHAVHHLAFHEEERGTLYTGDIAAVRLGGTAYVRPPTPPPELDLPAWRRSVGRLRSLGCERLCLTHFGEYEDVDWHFDDLLARLFHWAGWVEARLEAGADPATITAELEQRGESEMRQLIGEALSRPYELATNYRMSVDGFARYFRKIRERSSH